MTKEIEAVYEQGMIRPLQPLELPDWTHLHLILNTHEPPKTNRNAAEILAEIAALPLDDAFADCEQATSNNERDLSATPKRFQTTQG